MMPAGHASSDRVDRRVPPRREIWRGIAVRTALPAVITMGLFVATVFFIALPAFERHIMTTREEKARDLVATAIALLATYDQQVNDGTLELAEAQARAGERLRGLRYGEEGKDYFWITDLQPIVVMHPYLREIEGTDILNMPDSEGRPLIYAFLDIVAGPDRGGFCKYQWQRQDQRGRTLDKVSYVKLFEPWGWIVGTGVYLDDIEARIVAMTRRLTTASLAILLAILGLSVFMVIQSVRREELRLVAEQAVAEREQALRAILDNTVQFIGLLAPDGAVLVSNRTATEFIGAKSEDVVGKPFWDTPWWAHSQDAQQELRRMVATCRDRAVQVRSSATHVGVDGVVRDVDFSLTPILGADGAVERLVAEGRDVSAINHAHAALAESERDLATILDSIQDGVVAVDAAGVILRLNPVARRLVGRPTERAVGRPLDEVLRLTDHDGQPLEGIHARMFGPEGFGMPLHASLPMPGGDPLTVELTAAAIGDAGAGGGGVLVLRDVTDELQLRAQLFQVQKLEAVGQLAGGVAHDFNNLLTGILGNAQLLQADLAGAESEQYAAEIIEASHRGADLTRQLLAFSRKGKFQDAPVDVGDLVEKVVRLLARSIDKRIELRTDLAAARATVVGDPSQLHNALLNLGLNARDAMPAGGSITMATRNVVLGADDRRLAGSAREPGEYLELSVTDTGTGMSAETRRHIFEPFFTTKPQGKGTGLGLAGVYGCIANHNGMVDVDTAPGVGTTFRILLPVTDQVAAPARTPVPAAATGHGRILVVEDEDGVRSFARRALERLGYEVEVCADGIEAAECARRSAGELDLVILDLIMPRISGEETYLLLREIDADVPILIASGYAQNQAVEDLIRRGAAGFIAKPYTLDELSRAVGDHLRRRRREPVANTLA